MNINKFKQKRNYDEMIMQSNNIEKTLSNKFTNLPIPKIQYKHFLNDELIRNQEKKDLN